MPKKKKIYTPSDYPNFPKKTWQYFSDLLPKVLNDYLFKKYRPGFITVCKGNYVSKNADEYVVGFIVGKENKGYSKVFSIDKKTKNISEFLVKEYNNVAEKITMHYVPVVEVYCEKGFIQSKLPIDGLPAYIFNSKTRVFEYSKEKSLFAP